MSHECILEVEAEKDILKLIAHHLLKACFKVITASTGNSALGKAQESRPVLIFLYLLVCGTCLNYVTIFRKEK